MKQSFAAPRGTRDIFGSEMFVFQHVETVARRLSERYGFERLELPVFEEARLYARGLGESSDAVSKELFFVSRGSPTQARNHDWALRPEPTAGIVRAYIEHDWYTRPGVRRMWTFGPMFRYDRPQTGRHRQFWQWDLEVLRDAGPVTDADLIGLAARFWRDLGLAVEVRVNSIGDGKCRPAYRDALHKYFVRYRAQLTQDSQRRLDTNPLRILDDKELDPALAGEAPRATDFLCAECAEHWEAFLSALEGADVAWAEDHRLVRGLDYYTRTTFEFFKTGSHGSQAALGGGGRYDGLVQLLGGRPTPAIGFGVGVDRTIAAIQEQSLGQGAVSPPLATVIGTTDALGGRVAVANFLRLHGPYSVTLDGSQRSIGHQINAAAKSNADFVVIVNREGVDGPVERWFVDVKDLHTGRQRMRFLRELKEGAAGWNL